MDFKGIACVVDELDAQVGTLMDGLYQATVGVWHCRSGQLRLTLDGQVSVLLSAGETLVTYPRHSLTVELLEAENGFSHASFGGRQVEAYFEAQGLFDGARGRTADLCARMTALGQRTGVLDGPACARLAEVLSSLRLEMRAHSNPLVFDALGVIHREVPGRIQQLKQLCARLSVSRSYLHRLFVQAGLGPPSDCIRRRQIYVIRQLLDDGRLSLADIAARTGFCSASNFGAFVKRLTGNPPGHQTVRP